MGRPQTRKRKPPARRESDASSTSTATANIDPKPREPERKKRKVGTGHTEAYVKWREALSDPSGPAVDTACVPPPRLHAIDYHRPLLLDGDRGRRSREALLGWFDGVSTSRQMPWRKPWIDPGTWTDDPSALRLALERRAYEVWISEIMLQQTRVAAVIDYWNRWMARWPTIRDLASAAADDVLAAWRGLGYYSRATRIHRAAALVVADPEMRGLLPEAVGELEARLPGVGRYTAGAISAIVFGRAAAMVDGNVMRVLSRQMGILGSIKTDKSVSYAIWAAAEALVQAVARNATGDSDSEGNVPISDRPGRWGQALMELGSTICTPKPNCSQCPITSTCRAYGEGLLIADGPDHTVSTRETTVTDIEDLCQLCEPFEEVPVQADMSDPGVLEPTTRAGKKASASRRATASRAISGGNKTSSETSLNADTMEVIVDYARRFPVKTIKKAVREEESLVCAIVRSDGQHLIHRRPEKGLLAGLWELPSHTLPGSKKSTALSRKRDAVSYASSLVQGGPGKSRSKRIQLTHSGELGSVPWLFSHLKLTMHVHLFTLEHSGAQPVTAGAGQTHRWASAEEVDRESMGTGMRKCWALVTAS